jgi:hypothetical protein
MDVKLVDLTLHIDEEVDHESRERIQDLLREMNGVMVAVSHDNRPHLMMVGYNPDLASSMQILNCVRNNGVHAQLIGL